MQDRDNRVSWPRLPEARKPLPWLRGLVLIAMLTILGCGNGTISPTVSAQPDNRNQLTPMVLAPETPEEINRANIEEMQGYLNDLPESPIKEFTIKWVDRLFVSGAQTISIGGMDIPIAYQNITVIEHDDTWSKGSASFRRDAPGEDIHALPSFYPQKDVTIVFPLNYRIPDVVKIDFHEGISAFSGVEPSILLELASASSGVPADFRKHTREFLLVKEAITLAGTFQWIEDSVTLMNQGQLETTLTTTTGEVVEVVTQSAGIILNNGGQTIAGLDLATYMLTMNAYKGDADMTEHLLGSPGYQNVVTRMQTLSFEGMDDSQIIYWAMRGGLQDADLQSNLRFVGNPDLAPN